MSEDFVLDPKRNSESLDFTEEAGDIEGQSLWRVIGGWTEVERDLQVTAINCPDKRL